MLSTHAKEELRNAVRMYVQYAPNSHLGNYTPREDIRSAFLMIRSHAEHSNDIFVGIRKCEDVARSYWDC